MDSIKICNYSDEAKEMAKLIATQLNIEFSPITADEERAFLDSLDCCEEMPETISYEHGAKSKEIATPTHDPLKRNTGSTLCTQMVSLRMNHHLLAELKSKSITTGVPYQQLISIAVTNYLRQHH